MQILVPSHFVCSGDGNGVISFFQDKLCNTLTDLENKNSNHIVSGNINVKYFAKNKEKVADYVNNLTMIGCKMKINNHTRFSENCRPSLLDHTLVYTTIIAHASAISGVTLFELSDHLAIFFMAKNTKSSLKNGTGTELFRCIKQIILKDFLTNLDPKMSKITLSFLATNFSTDVSEITFAFKSVLERHAPLRPQTRNEKRQNKKPLITQNILTSMKTNKIFSENFLKAKILKKKRFIKSIEQPDSGKKCCN